jgi:hypothetical protein
MLELYSVFVHILMIEKEFIEGNMKLDFNYFEFYCFRKDFSKNAYFHSYTCFGDNFQFILQLKLKFN